MKKKAKLFLITACAILVTTAVFMYPSKPKRSVVGHSKIDTIYTTIDLAADISRSDYERVTAMKIIFDTVKVTEVDSTAGNIVQKVKRVRDSSYWAWYPVPILDSAGRAYRNRSNTADSIIFKFIPVESRWVLNDLNKNWPAKR